MAFIKFSFRPRLVDSLKGYNTEQFTADLGSGITVGLVALPLAMAFAIAIAIASGLKPEAGLFTAIIAGFIISALGGSKVQIGGPAGAFIVIVYGILQTHGLANLYIATMMAGVLLFVMGMTGIGSLIRFIPIAIVIGFTNGIAVLIALSQVKDFLGLDIPKVPAEFFAQLGVLWHYAGTADFPTIALSFSSLGLIILWPRIAGLLGRRPAPVPVAAGDATITTIVGRARLFSRLPGTVVALVLATTTAWLLELPVETIGSRFGGIPQTLPAFALPEFNWQSARNLFGPTVTIALLGAIGPHKGSAELLRLARHAALSRPGLRFHVIGFTENDEAFADLPNVSITGKYDDADLPGLIAASGARVALFLHVWPETFSYTLSEAVAHGLIPVVPDLGAPADRVRDAGFGAVFPLPLLPDPLLDLLEGLAVGRLAPGEGTPAAFAVAESEARIMALLRDPSTSPVSPPAAEAPRKRSRPRKAD